MQVGTAEKYAAKKAAKKHAAGSETKKVELQRGSERKVSIRSG